MAAVSGKAGATRKRQRSRRTFGYTLPRSPSFERTPERVPIRIGTARKVKRKGTSSRRSTKGGSSI